MHQRDPDHFFTLLGKIFFVVLSLIVAFFLCEIGFRKLKLDRSISSLAVPINERYPRPYVESAGRPNTFNYNELGYRGALPAKTKAKGEIRVFVTGGSTVYYGAPPFSQLLEETFQAHGYRNVKVFNMGVVSSVSGQELARIIYDISLFQPDLVIQYNGGNDILHATNWDPRPGYPMNFLLYEHNPLLQLNGGYKHHFLLFLTCSQLMRYLLNSQMENTLVGLQGIWESQVAKFGSPKGVFLAAVKEYLRFSSLAAKATRSLGSDYLLAFQPLKMFQTVPAPKAALSREWEARDLALEEFARMRRTEAFGYVDLSTMFQGIQKEVFTDPIHIEQEFQKKVADALYGAVMKEESLARFRKKLRKSGAVHSTGLEPGMTQSKCDPGTKSCIS
ncbi:MAG TPA: hypothetical protein VIH99_13830 [Bdellovibrionota bacterium]|jgi:hypothetical protein